MKFALLCTLLLAAAALATSCCSSDNDIVTVAMNHSAGICDDNVFPSDCRQPQVFAPVEK